MKPLISYVGFILCLFLMVRCSHKFYSVLHISLPETGPDNVPSGKMYEGECLEMGETYVLELPNAIVCGEVLYIKRHNKLKKHLKEALRREDTINFLVKNQYIYSNHYLHTSLEPHQEASMYTDSMLHAWNGYHYYERDTVYATTFRHDEVHKFIHLKNKNRIGTADFADSKINTHYLIVDSQGHHLCSLIPNETCLFHVQRGTDTSKYSILLGFITHMSEENDSLLSIQVINEVTETSNLDKISAHDIMQLGLGFPQYHSPEIRSIKHNEITEFKPVYQISPGTVKEYNSGFEVFIHQFLTGMGPLLMLFGIAALVSIIASILD